MAQRFMATLAAAGLVIGAAAVTVIAVRDDGGSRPLLPLGSSAALDRSGEKSSAATSVASAAATTAGGAVGEPGPLLAVRPTTFTSNLPDGHTGEVPVWKVVSPRVSAATASKLAAAVGVSGEPRAMDGQPGFVVGPDDGSGPVLQVAGNGTVAWFYSDASAMTSSVVCSAQTAPPSTEPTATASNAPTPPNTSTLAPAPDQKPVVVTDCPAPTPPAGVISAQEAGRRASALLRAAGASFDQSLRWENSADEWGAQAMAMLQIDAHDTGLPVLQVFYGAEGRLQYANGIIGSLAKVASYPRIGITAALAELSSGNAGYGGYGGYGGGPVAVSGVATSGSSGASNGASSADSGPAVDATAVLVPTTMPVPTTMLVPTTMPADSVGGKAVPPTAVSPGQVAAPEPTTTDVPSLEVDLVAVSDGWMAVGGSDGVAYLVPDYQFTDATGGSWVVMAIDDRYVIPQDQAGVGTPGIGGSGGTKGIAVPQPAPAAEPAVATTTR